MCKVGSKSKRKSFTGYKLVVKKNNKYYSPVTGIEYKERKEVQTVTKNTMNKYENNSNGEWSSIERIFGYFYDAKMKGKTGVFKRLEDANSIKHVGEVIVEMTISKNLHNAILNANFNTRKIIVGEFIESIEEIK